MFFNNRRVDEDIERIRKANLSGDGVGADADAGVGAGLDLDVGAGVDAGSGAGVDARTGDARAEVGDGGGCDGGGDLRVSAKDVLAMTIAVFSLLLPYLAVLAAVTALVLLWFFR